MVYLNNSATSFPKPKSVIEAINSSLMSPPENQFRSGSKQGEGNSFETCKNNLGKLLGIKKTNRIFFSSGATDAINRIFFGLGLEKVPIVITSTEHNSVLRPLFNSEKTRSNLHIVDCDERGKVDLNSLEKIVQEASKKGNKNSAFLGLITLNHCSNVTGAIQDAKAIGKIAHSYGFLFMLDVSQSAGCIPIDIDSWGVDIMVFTGHKALFGPQGTGGYYVREGLFFSPMLYGGTGRDSRQLLYMGQDDFEYEVGTQNLPGIIGLNAGIEYVLKRGVENIFLEEKKKMRFLYSELKKNPKIKIYGNETENLGPLVSLNIMGLKAKDVGYILENAYSITVRTGLHCSPLIHRALKTQEEGTIRVSISDLTSRGDIQAFINAINEITENL